MDYINAREWADAGHDRPGNGAWTVDRASFTRPPQEETTFAPVELESLLGEAARRLGLIGVPGAMMTALRQTATPQVLPNLIVLLGPDYAGKTSAMARLSQRLDGQFVSHEDFFAGESASFINCLKKEFLKRLDGCAAGFGSPALMLSLLQPIVTFMREQILSARSAPCIVVDGYYYKPLAKCLLLGLVDEELFASWQRMPQPGLVIYLHASPETTWRRTQGRSLNPFEYYGSRPSRAGFQSFQRDLADALLRVVGDAPVRMIRSDESLDRVAHEIECLITQWSAR